MSIVNDPLRPIDKKMKFSGDFYTDDFDQDMIDYLKQIGHTLLFHSGSQPTYLYYGEYQNSFWANSWPHSMYKHLTKQQFKDKIGMNNMTNKEELQNNIERIEKELAEMKKTLAEENCKRAGSFGVVPKDGGSYYRVCKGTNNLFTYFHGTKHLSDSKETLYWKDSSEARNFAEALNVMFELRTLEGVKAWCKTENNWYLYYALEEDKFKVIYTKLYLGAGDVYFDSEANARKAIETIGEERLKNAFKTLAGIKI